MASKVFISYSRRDGQTAAAIQNTLQKAGISCFRDESSIAPGDPFPERIGAAIQGCSAVVVVLSTNIAESDWVEAEVRFARLANKWLIPYRIDESNNRPEILPSHLQEVRSLAALLRAIVPNVRIQDISPNDVEHLEVPGLKGIYSSFHPVDSTDGSLFRVRVPTTSGWMPSVDPGKPVTKIENQQVYIIRDPIRPFEIQIGETRSRRPGGTPGAIELDSRTYNNQYLLGTWNQLVRDPVRTKWERAVLAEVAPDGDLLRAMYESEKDKWIKGLIGRNPAAPDDIKKEECPFCDEDFIRLRQRYPQEISHESSAVIIHNDFPFGPHFHYIVIPTASVHSWDQVIAEHLLAMNELLVRFLHDPKNRLGSAGLRIGFNSSVRHLVAGAKTRASAGASISHIHKQAWGMAKGSFNLGDQLARICDAYEERRGIDYLKSYLSTLRQAGLVIAEDDFIALYVPLGQIAAHELQIMIKRPTKTFLDLTYDELRSVSFAELGVAKLYAALGINSYNGIVITQQFDASDGANFRLIFAFVTREIDLAVSELNMLYVTDKHPYDTVVEADRHWAQVAKDNSLPFVGSAQGAH